jgi:hypothetical protein
MGVPRAAVPWLASYGKGALMRVAVRTGLAGRLVRRRGRPPTDAERQMVREALRASRR